MKTDSIFVAATNQHVGKTTSTLGLVTVLKQAGVNVGYCKPVGQQHLDYNNLRVDKDTVLFAELLNFDIVPEHHSPVILGKGTTSAYLDRPEDFDFVERIENARDALSQRHDMVIYEGTGHPGVGSIANISNPRVAKIVNAGAIMIVEGGIGATIDRLNLSLSLFREMKVPIVGVIVNKVKLDKMDKVQHYVGMKLKEMNLNLLGVLPYDQSLAFPIMRTIVDAIKGTVVYNIDHLENKVENIMAGSLIDVSKLQKTNSNLLVVGVDRVHNAIHKIDLLSKVHGMESTPLAGIVAAGDGTFTDETVRYVEEHDIPLVRTQLDTYGSVVKISNIEVKINLHTPWKIQKAIKLIKENVNLDKILEAADIRPIG